MASFTRNVIITSISQVGVLILGIGTSIIVAHVLSPDWKGIDTLVGLFVSFFVFVYGVVLFVCLIRACFKKEVASFVSNLTQS